MPKLLHEPLLHFFLRGALLAFNVGVELGQLLFVACVLALTFVFARVKVAVPRWATYAPAYAIGSIAMLWTIQRVLAFTQ